MTPDRIDPVLVEKGAKAILEDNRAQFVRDASYQWEDLTEEQRSGYRSNAEATIRVVFNELRLKEELSSTWRRNPDGSRQVCTRLVSKWRAVEQGEK